MCVFVRLRSCSWPPWLWRDHPVVRAARLAVHALPEVPWDAHLLLEALMARAELVVSCGAQGLLLHVEREAEPVQCTDAGTEWVLPPRILGRGTHGTVVLAAGVDSLGVRHELALKVMLPEARSGSGSGTASGGLGAHEMEVAVIQALQGAHPLVQEAVVPCAVLIERSLVGVDPQEPQGWTVVAMRRMAGSLRDFLEGAPAIELACVCDRLALGQGLVHLAGRLAAGGFAWLDVKCGNVLYGAGPGGCLHLMVGDLGGLLPPTVDASVLGGAVATFPAPWAPADELPEPQEASVAWALLVSLLELLGVCLPERRSVAVSLAHASAAPDPMMNDRPSLRAAAAEAVDALVLRPDACTALVPGALSAACVLASVVLGRQAPLSHVPPVAWPRPTISDIMQALAAAVRLTVPCTHCHSRLETNDSSYRKK